MFDFAIETGGLTTCGAHWRSPGWVHEPLHKLYHVTQGTGRYAVPGQQLTLAPGRIYLIPGGRPHRHGPAAAMVVHWLHFRALSPLIERRIAALPGIVAIGDGDWRWWDGVWEDIPAWLAARDLPGDLRLHSLIAMILADVFSDRRHDQSAPGTTPGLDPRLERALRWMNEHCREHPPLEAIARIAGLAPAVFQRRFTAAFSSSPRLWLETRRMDHARRLLRQPGARVQDVATACGYANPFHFSRVVRRRLGVNPRSLAKDPGP
jgi:AraC-like DNA-binding protein